MLKAGDLMDGHRKCIICGGLFHNGIKILDRFICNECEKTLVDTDICDGIYDEYKELIKNGIYGSAVNQTVK